MMQTRRSLTTSLPVSALTLTLVWCGAVRGVDRTPTAAQAPPGYVAPSVAPKSVVAGAALTCPSGALVEPESCRLDASAGVNEGCNDSPAQFTEIPNNFTVCGIGSTFLNGAGANFRDTDWYRFTLPSAARVEWCATAEFRVRLFVLQGTCPASSLGSATAQPMIRACVSLDLPAGTYNAFVATETFTGVPCGASNAYVATLRTGAHQLVTYQGQLKRDGSPFNGSIDAQFRLFDSDTDGTQFGPTNDRPGVQVVNGLFTVELDFGLIAFDGDPRFLEITVDDGTISPITLAPRQPITFTPHAAHASVAGHSLSAATVDWSGVTNVPSQVTDFNSLNASDGSPIDAIFVDTVGNVGIGTTTPGNRLSVSGAANFTGFVGFGVAAPDTPVDAARSSGAVGAFNRLTTDGAVVAIQQDGATQGTISVSGTTVSYNAFTGSHYAWTEKGILPGALVSLNGNNRRLGDRSAAEVLYGIDITTKANDPACLGVFSGLEEPTRHAGPNNPHLVAAVGNGELCVVDRGGGDIEPGDYLISSDVPGCAMKDDPTRFEIGHCIGKSADRIRWNQIAPDEYGVKRAKASVLFGAFIRGESAKELRERIARLENVLLEQAASQGDKGK